MVTDKKWDRKETGTQKTAQGTDAQRPRKNGTNSSGYKHSSNSSSGELANTACSFI